jgi:hypothetical protein
MSDFSLIFVSEKKQQRAKIWHLAAKVQIKK